MHRTTAPKRVRTLPRSAYIRQVMRAGGPGGQHQNKTESAVRLIHIATGIAAESRSEKSQATNFDLAMASLIAKLDDAAAKAREAESKSGYRAKPRAAFSSQARSYVLDRDRRVVDHRTGHSSDQPDAVLRGGIDGFLSASLRARV